MPMLRARDAMRTDIVTMPPDTPVATIARLFTDRGVSAVPITDAGGALVGIVTEADLVRRLADEDEAAPAGWLVRLFDNADIRAQRYARRRARRDDRARGDRGPRRNRGPCRPPDGAEPHPARDRR